MINIKENCRMAGNACLLFCFIVLLWYNVRCIHKQYIMYDYHYYCQVYRDASAQPYINTHHCCCATHWVANSDIISCVSCWERIRSMEYELIKPSSGTITRDHIYVFLEEWMKTFRHSRLFIHTCISLKW